MRISPSVLSSITAVLLVAGASGAAVAAPYYDPSNAASSSGKTTGYEIYKTIGCPGKGLLEAPCAGDAPAKPAAPAPAAKPAPAPTPAPVAKPAPAPAPAPVLDGDGDGVIDAHDKCPTTPAGRKVNAQGCELDGDGDGVVDALDKCPTTPAGRTVNAQGCELDGDGDGVVDGLDKCPTTPAYRRVDANGCEFDGDADGVVDALDKCLTTPAGNKVNAEGCDLDSDGDGVIDAADQCPGTPAGTKVESNGCAVAKVINLKGVNFDNDQASLRPDAVAILNQAVAALKESDKVKVEVAGHTDNRSSAAHNLDLSQRRAKTVMDYFVAHGIDAARLTSKGYGLTQPIADNETDAGRATNRRVELRILN